MASRFRSLISNKIIQSLDKFPIGGNGIKSSKIIPHIRVGDGKHDVNFIVSLDKLMRKNVLYDKEEQKKINIEDVIDAIKERFKTDSTIESASINSKLLQIKVNKSKLNEEVITLILNRPDSFWLRSGLLSSFKPRRVVIDYSSPNIAKPFHVGHLRSTIIGQFIANINKALGHKVTSINYLGDWGTQFGLLKYGYDAQNLTPLDLEQDAIKKLYKVYVWANSEAETSPQVYDTARQIFSQMENGDEEQLQIWRLFRELSIKELTTTYDRLGIIFDKYDGESLYCLENIKDLIKLLLDKNILQTTQDGRKVFESHPQQFETMVKSDGTPMYLLRDVAGAIDRYERYQFDDMYYVVDNKQCNHFIALFKIMEQLGYSWAAGMKHIKFGNISGMSTRKGTAVFLKDILDEAQHKMIKVQKELNTTKENVLLNGDATADIVGMTSLILADMTMRRMSDYDFSWDNIIKRNGDRGIMLQYAHCRLVSLEKTCGFDVNLEADLSLLTGSVVHNLVCVMARFDEVLLNAYEQLEPCVIVNYLYKLNKSINSAYRELPLKSAKREEGEARLALFIAARQVLGIGMKILGIKPLQEM